MSLNIRGKSDKYLRGVTSALSHFAIDHPRAEIETYRQNSASIRVRIIDDTFAGMDKAERHAAIWKLLDGLPEEVQSQISVLLLLSPDEKTMSFASQEFDDPIPSRV